MTKLNYKSASDKDELLFDYGKRPQILRLEYPSNQCSNLPQILDLSLCDQHKL